MLIIRKNKRLTAIVAWHFGCKEFNVTEVQMMKLTAKLPIGLILALLIIPIIFLPGCGDNTAVPDKSTITITPSNPSLKNPPMDTVVNFKVTIRYSDGTPVPNARMFISGGFAQPNASGLYQFYYYPDGTQNPTGNTAVNSGYEAQADDFGVYNFSIVLSGSAFNDTIYVTSGTVVGVATIAVTTGT